MGGPPKSTFVSPPWVFCQYQCKNIGGPVQEHCSYTAHQCKNRFTPNVIALVTGPPMFLHYSQRNFFSSNCQIFWFSNKSTYCAIMSKRSFADEEPIYPRNSSFAVIGFGQVYVLNILHSNWPNVLTDITMGIGELWSTSIGILEAIFVSTTPTRHGYCQLFLTKIINSFGNGNL